MLKYISIILVFCSHSYATIYNCKAGYMGASGTKVVGSMDVDTLTSQSSSIVLAPYKDIAVCQGATFAPDSFLMCFFTPPVPTNIKFSLSVINKMPFVQLRNNIKNQNFIAPTASIIDGGEFLSFVLPSAETNYFVACNKQNRAFR